MNQSVLKITFFFPSAIFLLNQIILTNPIHKVALQIIHLTGGLLPKCKGRPSSPGLNAAFADDPLSRKHCCMQKPTDLFGFFSPIRLTLWKNWVAPEQRRNCSPPLVVAFLLRPLPPRYPCLHLILRLKWKPDPMRVFKPSLHPLYMNNNCSFCGTPGPTVTLSKDPRLYLSCIALPGRSAGCVSLSRLLTCILPVLPRAIRPSLGRQRGFIGSQSPACPVCLCPA